MATWTWPAAIAVLFGSLLFVGLLVPLVVWQSRRYGRLSTRRTIGAAAVAVYGVALVAYTLLPLPSGDLATWCAAHAVDGMQAQLFQCVADIRRETAGLGLRGTLLHPATRQVVFNVVLFVPWGVLWRRFLGRGVVTATLSGLLVSLAIETTQYTGIFGLIGCSYRVADVDDLLANTVGALIGAVIAPVVLHWMPQSRDLAPERGVPRPVTLRRRWGSMLLDAFAYVALGVVGTFVWRVATFAHGDGRIVTTWGEWVVGSAAPFVVVFVLPVLGSGASLGQRALWLVPRRAGARPTLARRAVRALVPGGLWGACSALASLPDDDALPHWLLTVPFGTFASLLVLAAVVAVVATPDRRGLSGAVAGVELTDVRSLPGR
jgi:glycopeptide antibiotics resistance protein